MRMRSICMFLGILSLLPAPLQAITVSGQVSGTWTAADSPVMVEGDLLVASGAALIIAPGVSVLFTGPYSLTVAGALHAVGSSDEPILFTRATATDESRWRGIRFTEADDASILEYCRIEHTYRNSSSYTQVHGGGVAIFGCSPTVRYCRISNHYTRNTNYNGAGAAIYLGEGSNSLIERNHLIDNQSDSGGAIFIGVDSRPTIKANLIENNEAAYSGGGIYLGAWADADIEGNVIRNNTAGYWGGGGITLWNNGCSTGTCTRVFNNVINGNAAISPQGQYFGNGGGIYCRYNESDLFNNTIVGNSAAYEGGGIYVLNQGSEIPRFSNSVIWGNTAPIGPQLSLESGTSTAADVTFSNVQGGWSGAGNLDSQPLFGNPTAGFLQLLPGSPGIDSGNNAIVALVAADIDGHLRILDGDGNGSPTVDMGAFEYDPDLQLLGDVDGSRVIELIDTILVLQLLAGQDIGLTGDRTGIDVNGDGVIGLAEALYTLQYQAWQPE